MYSSRYIFRFSVYYPSFCISSAISSFQLLFSTIRYLLYILFFIFLYLLFHFYIHHCFLYHQFLYEYSIRKNQKLIFIRTNFINSKTLKMIFLFLRLSNSHHQCRRCHLIWDKKSSHLTIYHPTSHKIIRKQLRNLFMKRYSKRIKHK